MIEKKFVLRNKQVSELAAKTIEEIEIDQDKPIEIVIRKYKSKRSVPQNSLYWRWLSSMSVHFSKKGGNYSSNDMHDLMRHKFLGYVPRKIGNTELNPQLLSTTDLDTHAMAYYMHQIDAWCADHGLLLPSIGEYSENVSS